MLRLTQELLEMKISDVEMIQQASDTWLQVMRQLNVTPATFDDTVDSFRVEIKRI